MPVVYLPGMAGKSKGGAAVNFRVRLTGDTADAYRKYKAGLRSAGPEHTDSKILAFLVAVALGVEKMPRVRRKDG